MWVGILTAKLSIPDSHGLKDKRAVLRSLKDRVRNRQNVSVGEVGRQDAWQYAELAFATVAAEEASVRQRLGEIAEFLRSDPRYVLLSTEEQLLAP